MTNRVEISPVNGLIDLLLYFVAKDGQEQFLRRLFATRVGGFLNWLEPHLKLSWGYTKLGWSVCIATPICTLSLGTMLKPKRTDIQKGLRITAPFECQKPSWFIGKTVGNVLNPRETSSDG